MEVAAHPKPPKKPLTPYMRYSKSVWQTVKVTNNNMSVCEIGAHIGKMWRELSDEEKQRFNHEFAQEKIEYDERVQEYLKLTGLQPSDLNKSRSKKKAEAKLAREQQQQQQQMARGLAAMPSQGYASPSGAALIAASQYPASSMAAAALPHFSQIWASNPYQQNIANMAMAGNMDAIYQQVAQQHQQAQEVAQQHALQLTTQSQSSPQCAQHSSSDPHSSMVNGQQGSPSSHAASPDIELSRTTSASSNNNWSWAMATNDEINDKSSPKASSPADHNAIKDDINSSNQSTASPSPTLPGYGAYATSGSGNSVWEKTPSILNDAAQIEILKRALAEKTQQCHQLAMKLEQAVQTIDQLQRTTPSQ